MIALVLITEGSLLLSIQIGSRTVKRMAAELLRMIAAVVKSQILKERFNCYRKICVRILIIDIDLATRPHIKLIQ